MQIGQAAKASGASAKMIRHYEAIGLIAPAGRRDSNYRDYSADDVARLQFIRRARDLGFPIDRIRELLALWGDRGRSSAEVKRIALDHITELEERIAGMRDMVAALHRLADGCAGDDRPDCPIIEGLAGRSGRSRAQAPDERLPPAALRLTATGRSVPTAPESPRRAGRPPT
jgi:MerR family transcriptional regulator, copper efflux regulator